MLAEALSDARRQGRRAWHRALPRRTGRGGGRGAGGRRVRADDTARTQPPVPSSRPHGSPRPTRRARGGWLPRRASGKRGGGAMPRSGYSRGDEPDGARGPCRDRASPRASARSRRERRQAAELLERSASRIYEASPDQRPLRVRRRNRAVARRRRPRPRREAARRAWEIGSRRGGAAELWGALRYADALGWGGAVERATELWLHAAGIPVGDDLRSRCAVGEALFSAGDDDGREHLWKRRSRRRGTQLARAPCLWAAVPGDGRDEVRTVRTAAPRRPERRSLRWRSISRERSDGPRHSHLDRGLARPRA